MTVYEDEMPDGKLINQYKQSDQSSSDALKLIDLPKMGDNLIG